MCDTDKDTEPTASVTSSSSSIPTLFADDIDQGDSGNGTYKYRDFSRVGEDDEEGPDAPDVPSGPPSSRGNMESSIRVQKFPVKLYAILAQKEFHDIITWMPHGRAWKVLKPSLFESLVMPLFFEYSNYHSFNRLVNAWSFRRVSSGPDRGSYYHELFLRGKPHLQKYMRRLPKTQKKTPMRKEDEPDFYSLDKTNPLPALEDAPIPGLSTASSQQQQPQLPMVPQPNKMMNSHVITPPHPSMPRQSQSMMCPPSGHGRFNNMYPPSPEQLSPFPDEFDAMAPQMSRSRGAVSPTFPMHNHHQTQHQHQGGFSRSMASSPGMGGQMQHMQQMRNMPMRQHSMDYGSSDFYPQQPSQQQQPQPGSMMMMHQHHHQQQPMYERQMHQPMMMMRGEGDYGMMPSARTHC